MSSSRWIIRRDETRRGGRWLALWPAARSPAAGSELPYSGEAVNATQGARVLGQTPRATCGPACGRGTAGDRAAGPTPTGELYKPGEVAPRRRSAAGADDTASGIPGRAARPDASGPRRRQGPGGRWAMRADPGGGSPGLGFAPAAGCGQGSTCEAGPSGGGPGIWHVCKEHSRAPGWTWRALGGDVRTHTGSARLASRPPCPRGLRRPRRREAGRRRR